MVRAEVRVLELLRSAGRISMPSSVVRDLAVGEEGLRARPRRVYLERRVGWLVMVVMMERPCWVVAGRMVRSLDIVVGGDCLY